MLSILRPLKQIRRQDKSAAASRGSLFGGDNRMSGNPPRADIRERRTHVAE
jgi:hypothetical protein